MRRIGPIATTLIRSFLTIVSIGLSIVSGLIIVRLLKPIDYATYQFITKRLSLYIVSLVRSINNIWGYRYLVQGIKGGFQASIVVSLILSIVGFLVTSVTIGLLLGYTSTISFIGALYVAFFVIWAGFFSTIDALRPLRSGFILLITRLANSVFVILLVYVFGAGLLGALISGIVAYILASALSYFWSREKAPPPGRIQSIISEWISSIKVPLWSWIRVNIANIDVIIGYAFSTPNVIAAFFASRLIPGIAEQASGQGLSYLHRLVLSSRSIQTGTTILRLTLLLLAPMVAVLVVETELLVYVINPQYMWALNGFRLIILSLYFRVLGNGLVHLISGTISEIGVEAEPKLFQLHRSAFIPSLLYILLLPLLVFFDEVTQVVYWSFLFLFYSIVFSLVLLMHAYEKYKMIEPGVLIKDASSYIITAFLFSILVRSLFPNPNGTTFWSALLLLLYKLLIVLVLYFMTIIMIDKDVRYIVRSILEKATK